MRKSDIQKQTDEELLGYLERLGGERLKEVNFGRGYVTQKTAKQLEWTVEEIGKRFNVDQKQLLSIINER